MPPTDPKVKDRDFETQMILDARLRLPASKSGCFYGGRFLCVLANPTRGRILKVQFWNLQARQHSKYLPQPLRRLGIFSTVFPRLPKRGNHWALGHNLFEIEAWVTNGSKKISA